MLSQKVRTEWMWVAGLLGAGGAGCGGGGGSDTTAPAPVPAPPPAPAAVTLTGTAAAGLPLVGTVTVKDATGATKTVTLNANGGYTVDVTGMTAPVMLRAEGTVGANTYIIHSASASVSASGTVNITPLTDLVVANAAGQIAASYFAGSSFAKLTQAELDSETAALKAKLLPVLQAMKVDASIDLLRTPFTPLSSALDKALDVLRVSVDPATQVATITNLVNQIAITDNLATKAAAETTATPLAASNMATTADDLPQIRAAFTDIFALLATGAPQPAQVLAKLSSGFLHQDTKGSDFANGIASAVNLVGATVTSLEILSIDYGNNGGANPLARIAFRIKNSKGISQELNTGWTVIKGSDGVWRLNGDQRVLDIEGHAHHTRNALTGCIASGLEFNIRDNDSSNSAAINTLRITGPGLPASGLKYQRPATGGDFTLVGTNNPFWYPMTETCANNWGAAGVSDSVIAAIPDSAVYTISAFTANGAPVPLGSTASYTELLGKRPMTLAEVQKATFPTINTASDFASYGGGALTVSGTGVDPGNTVWFYLGLTDTQGQVRSADTDLNPSAAGAYEGSLNLTAPSTAVTRREIRVASHDGFRRHWMSVLVR